MSSLRSHLGRCLLASVVATALLAPAARAARHLFLDPATLTELQGATLHVNSPHAREAILRPDKPWEKQVIGAFVTVREEDGLVRMWYCCRDADKRLFLAYAQSRDGLTWEKPALGVFDYHGSKDNNLLIEHFWEGTPFVDPKAAGPEEKYVYLGHAPEKGMYRFTSPDGLRWRQDAHRLLPFRVDTHDVVFWDEQIGKYALYLRGWHVPGAWDERMRKVVRLTLDTLALPVDLPRSGKGDNPKRANDLPRIVDELPTVMTTDGLDPKNSDVYNPAVQPYPVAPEWYLGFPSFFRRQNLVDGRLEVQFVGSRDGIAWHRYDHAPYVAPGLAGSDSSSRTYLGVGMLVRGDELWQYGVSYWSPHGALEARQSEMEEERPVTGEQRSDGTIYRYTQRVDGFVSLDFDLRGGRAVTVPVKVDGARLRLNVDTGALGDLRVALLDQAGKPLPGFTAEECDLLETNSIRALASWRGKSDLTALAGQEVRVQFTGTRAKLYSFYFGPAR